MESACTPLVERIGERLSSGFDAFPHGAGCVIITPFVYPDMAPIELYAELRDGSYHISDQGETLNLLFVKGLAVEENDDLLQEVQRIARMQHVGFQQSTLSVITAPELAGEDALALINAIQATSYLIYKRSHRARHTFDEEVARLFIEHRVSYQPGLTVHGAANTHQIAFYINSGRNILLEPLSTSNVPSAREQAKHVAYKWVDIRQAAPHYQRVVMLDDREGRERIWSDAEAAGALNTYSDKVLRWSEDQLRLIDMAGGRHE